MSKYSVTDDSQLATLDGQLKDNLYIGGHSPNAEDALVFEQFSNGKSEPNQDKHPNLWAWFALLSIYTPSIRESWKSQQTQGQGQAQGKQQGAKKTEEKAEAKTENKTENKAEVKDETDDLFGDDNEDDAKALEDMKKKKEQDKAGKKPKPEVIAKSLILLEVKVWDPEQDYDALAKKILTIQRDGLFWKTEYQLKDVAFGVKKILIGLVVEDEKVSIDDIIDEIQSWEEEVQSVDIAAFNKI